MLSQQLIRFGDFELDLGSYELRRSGLRVKLEKQPFELLVLLATSGGRLITRQDIINKLWGNDVFLETDQGINNAIRKIRIALRDRPERPCFVETVTGKGYRFIPRIAELAVSATPAVLAPAKQRGEARVEGHPQSSPLAGDHRSVSQRMFRFGAPVAILFSLAAVAMITSFSSSHSRLKGTLAPTQTGHIDSLAVLPLENLSGDREQDYFADEMTDELVTKMAQISALRVASRTSAMHYKGTRKTLQEIARELDVDAVVEGTVVRSGLRVRITAQLIDARTDKHLWANTYESGFRDVLLLQSEVAQDIAHEIRAHLTEPEKTQFASARSINPEAYEAFLKGRYFFNKWTTEGFNKGSEYFKIAIRIDPNYAAAYAGLADCYQLLGTSGAVRPNEVIPKAEASAQQALRLDDGVADAHFSLANAYTWYDWNWAGAEREFRRGMELNSNNALGRMWYSLYLSILGHLEEGVREQRRALELDPMSLIMNANLARAYYFARRYDEAIAQAKATLEMDPGFGMAVLYLSRAYAQKGLYGQLVALLQEHSPMGERMSAEERLVLGGIYEHSGYHTVLQELLKHEDPVYAAPLYAQLGDKERAFESLERCYTEHCRYISYLKVQPDFDILRSDPRYRDLLRRIGMPQ
jgi:TolB-like protein/DNA-binding winged helix-turn-helix (wHTH) protein/Tfp pilus assembly protein PilF